MAIALNHREYSGYFPFYLPTYKPSVDLTSVIANNLIWQQKIPLATAMRWYWLAKTVEVDVSLSMEEIDNSTPTVKTITGSITQVITATQDSSPQSRAALVNSPISFPSFAVSQYPSFSCSPIGALPSPLQVGQAATSNVMLPLWLNVPSATMANAITISPDGTMLNFGSAGVQVFGNLLSQSYTSPGVAPLQTFFAWDPSDATSVWARFSATLSSKDYGFSTLSSAPAGYNAAGTVNFTVDDGLSTPLTFEAHAFAPSAYETASFSGTVTVTLTDAFT